VNRTLRGLLVRLAIIEVVLVGGSILFAHWDAASVAVAALVAGPFIVFVDYAYRQR
jgi:hypothetical protein